MRGQEERLVGEVGELALTYRKNDDFGEASLRVYSRGDLVASFDRKRPLGPQIEATWRPSNAMSRDAFLDVLVADVAALKIARDGSDFNPDIYMFRYDERSERWEMPSFCLDDLKCGLGVVKMHPAFEGFYELGSRAACFSARYTDARAALIPGWPPENPWSAKEGYVHVCLIDSLASWIPYFAAHTSGYGDLERLQERIGKFLLGQ